MSISTVSREHLNAYIDTDVRRGLERLARENDRTLSAEVRRALREYVERDYPEEEAA